MLQTRDNKQETGQMVLEVNVINHPGVMSHISGLFARRLFNLEGIHCMPLPGGRLSRMYLVVNQDQRLDQIIRQVQKLEDVIDVCRCTDEHQILEQLEAFSRS